MGLKPRDGQPKGKLQWNSATYALEKRIPSLKCALPKDIKPIIRNYASRYAIRPKSKS